MSGQEITLPPAYTLETMIQIDGGELRIVSNYYSSFTRCPMCDDIIKVTGEKIKCDNQDFRVYMGFNLEKQLKKDVLEHFNRGEGL